MAQAMSPDRTSAEGDGRNVTPLRDCRRPISKTTPLHAASSSAPAIVTSRSHRFGKSNHLWKPNKPTAAIPVLSGGLPPASVFSLLESADAEFLRSSSLPASYLLLF